MEIELLPCPFCGQQPVQLRDMGRDWVYCGKAECPARPCVTSSDNMDSAAWQWNKRAVADENEQEAGTMRMLREKAQEMGYSDVLAALEALEDKVPEHRRKWADEYEALKVVGGACLNPGCGERICVRLKQLHEELYGAVAA